MSDVVNNQREPVNAVNDSIWKISSVWENKWGDGRREEKHLSFPCWWNTVIRRFCCWQRLASSDRRQSWEFCGSDAANSLGESTESDVIIRLHNLLLCQHSHTESMVLFEKCVFKNDGTNSTEFREPAPLQAQIEASSSCSPLNSSKVDFCR